MFFGSSQGVLDSQLSSLGPEVFSDHASGAPFGAASRPAFQEGLGFGVWGLGFWVFGFLGFWVFGFLGFGVFGFLGFWVFWVFGFLGFWAFRVLGFQGFRVLGFQGFRASGFQGFRV